MIEYLHWIITTVLWFVAAVAVYGGIIVGLGLLFLYLSNKH